MCLAVLVLLPLLTALRFHTHVPDCALGWSTLVQIVTTHKNNSTAGRDTFLSEVFKWVDEYGGRICTQLRRMGSSVDWERCVFTMDDTRSVSAWMQQQVAVCLHIADSVCSSMASVQHGDFVGQVRQADGHRLACSCCPS
jgi:hypothetical protein